MLSEHLETTGTCWCSCGEEVETGAFFTPGHDSVAESSILDLKYGGRPELLAEHGYGPGQENLYEAVKRKYAPLAKHLATQTSDRVILAFDDIEQIIGAALPRMARSNRNWWLHNGNRIHPYAWIEVGWDVNRISIKRQVITFVRDESA
jgi:hypothetical protein